VRREYMLNHKQSQTGTQIRRVFTDLGQFCSEFVQENRVFFADFEFPANTQIRYAKELRDVLFVRKAQEGGSTGIGE